MSGKDKKRSKVFAAVNCTVHGSKEKVMMGQVKCAIPTTKKARLKGCPLCRKDSNA